MYNTYNTCKNTCRIRVIHASLLMFFFFTMTVFLLHYIPVSLCWYLFYFLAHSHLLLINKLLLFPIFYLIMYIYFVRAVFFFKMNFFQNLPNYTIKHYFLSLVQSLNIYLYIYIYIANVDCIKKVRLSLN